MSELIEDLTEVTEVLANAEDSEDAEYTEDAEDSEITEDMEVSEDPEDEEDAAYQELLHGAFGKTYVSAQDRYNDLKSSGQALRLCGVLLIACAVVDGMKLVNLPFNDITLGAFIVMGVGCLLYSMITYKNANIAKQSIATEQKRRNEIVKWCTDTYSADVIDDRVYAQEGSETISIEVMDLKRLEMIQSFISREYPMEDEAFVENISEEVFGKLFSQDE